MYQQVLFNLEVNNILMLQYQFNCTLRRPNKNWTGFATRPTRDLQAAHGQGRSSVGGRQDRRVRNKSKQYFQFLRFRVSVFFGAPLACARGANTTTCRHSDTAGLQRIFLSPYVCVVRTQCRKFPKATLALKLQVVSFSIIYI